MRILFTSLLSLSASVVVVSVSGLDVSNNNLSDAIFIEGTPTGNLRRVLKGQDQGATDRGSRMLQGKTKTDPSPENNGIFGDFQQKSSSTNTPGEGNGEGQGTTNGQGYGAVTAVSFSLPNTNINNILVRNLYFLYLCTL